MDGSGVGWEEEGKHCMEITCSTAVGSVMPCEYECVNTTATLGLHCSRVCKQGTTCATLMGTTIKCNDFLFPHPHNKGEILIKIDKTLF